MGKTCNVKGCEEKAVYEMERYCNGCPSGNKFQCNPYCQKHLSELMNGKLDCSLCHKVVRAKGDYTVIGAVPNTRVGDKERNAATERLSAAAGDGQLTMTEFEERLTKVADCKFGTDIEELVKDLPSVNQPVVIQPRAYPGWQKVGIACLVMIALVLCCMALAL